MKNIIINTLFILFIISNIDAQVLNVPVVTQEETNWCWAASSKCILDYYGCNKEQCEIVEFVRGISSWHDFGSVNCCDNSNQGCNYGNAVAGYSGSVEEVITHFGHIGNYAYYGYLNLNQIKTEITNNRPFTIWWKWASGGGHIMVGHGINGSDVNYMNPWYGEGTHICTYTWLVNDGNHYWNGSNTMLSSPHGISEASQQTNKIVIYPNPTNSSFTIETNENNNFLKIYNIHGQILIHENLKKNETLIDIKDLANGIYLLEVISDKSIFHSKIIKK